ncbi:MAG: nitroreductase family protein [Fibrobacteres bacterium]|nr:nitroreductase family protein [Fibrobacterota bacterium]
MSSFFSVDHDLCISCGKCIKECGGHVKIQNSIHVEPGNSECSGCLHCYTVCPKGAIKLNNPLKAPDLDFSVIGDIREKSLSSFLAFRRSIRSYRAKLVEDEIIKLLIDRSRYIPSGGNSHSYEFTILKSDAVKSQIREELKRIYKFRERLLNNPLLRTIAKPFVNSQMKEFLKSDIYRARMKELVARIYEGDDPFFHNSPAVIIIHSKELIPTPKEDAILAGYNICMIAQTLGLGACFVTLAQNAFNGSRRCKEILKIPSHSNVYAVVTIGYTDVVHKRIAPKPLKAISWV